MARGVSQLYGEIKADLIVIARIMLKTDNYSMEEKWRQIKQHISDVRKFIETAAAEEKARDRQEKIANRRSQIANS